MIDQLILGVFNTLVVLLTIYITWGSVAPFGIPMFSVDSTLWSLVIILLFVVNWGYFFALEYFWAGKTVGKRLLGIRVMQENGHSVTLLSCFIRNLLRIIDMLPIAYFIGIMMIFLHSKHKRLGDIVAGTLVVHERRVKGKRKEKGIEKEIRNRGLSQQSLPVDEWAIKQLGTKEWNLVKTYANRFRQLPLAERNALTKKLAAILFPKLELPMEGKTYEEFEDTLLLLYMALREEWEIEL